MTKKGDALQGVSQSVLLDIGGRHHSTTLGTLTNGRSRMLTAMFNGDLALIRTPEGRVLIDSDGDRFAAVLSFLRTGACTQLPASGSELARLLEEAEYYQVDGLEEAIRGRPALALHEAAAAALAAIDGPELRRAASLLIETAYYQHPEQEEAFYPRGCADLLQLSSDDAVLKPAGLPGETMLVRVTKASWPDSLDTRQAELLAGRVEVCPATMVKQSGLGPSVKVRSAVCSAPALITQPAAVAFLLTNELGVAHVSWKHDTKFRPICAITYSLRLE